MYVIRSCTLIIIRPSRFPVLEKPTLSREVTNILPSPFPLSALHVWCPPLQVDAKTTWAKPANRLLRRHRRVKIKIIRLAAVKRSVKSELGALLSPCETTYWLRSPDDRFHQWLFYKVNDGL